MLFFLKWLILPSDPAFCVLTGSCAILVKYRMGGPDRLGKIYFIYLFIFCTRRGHVSTSSRRFSGYNALLCLQSFHFIWKCFESIVIASFPITRFDFPVSNELMDQLRLMCVELQLGRNRPRQLALRSKLSNFLQFVCFSVSEVTFTLVSM